MGAIKTSSPNPSPFHFLRETPPPALSVPEILQKSPEIAPKSYPQLSNIQPRSMKNIQIHPRSAPDPCLIQEVASKSLLNPSPESSRNRPETSPTSAGQKFARTLPEKVGERPEISTESHEIHRGIVPKPVRTRPEICPMSSPVCPAPRVGPAGAASPLRKGEGKTKNEKVDCQNSAKNRPFFFGP